MSNIVKVIDNIDKVKSSTYVQGNIKSSGDSFIYVVSSLDEVDNVINLLEGHIPVSRVNDSSSLIEALSENENVCITHELLQGVTNRFRGVISGRGYSLILDDVVNVVSEIPNFTSDDLNMITVEDKLAYTEDNFLVWDDNELDYNGRFNDIKLMALNRNLISIDDRLLFWNFPADIFSYFKDVYILTHRLESMLQSYYFNFHGIKYEMYQIDDGSLVPYNDFREQLDIKNIRDKITVYDGKMNNVGKGKYTLSLNWFEKEDGADIVGVELKNNIYNWFNNINKDKKASERMWTVFKDYKDQTKGKGYTRGFVPLNYKTKGDYSNATVLAYCANRFVRPNTIQFFSSKGIKIDQDEYALTEMLRWIWKSGLKDGEDVSVYIPSSRMRALLIEWLDK